jgi:hypothetical protein
MTATRDLQFLLHTDIRPLGRLPSLKSALSGDGDSTALQAEYSLLISVFDFVSALRDIALG